MKNIFEKFIVSIRTWLWNRKREKNKVAKSRRIFSNKKLTFYPNESDYEHLICEYCEKNKREFSNYGKYDSFHPSVFQLYMKNGEKCLGFPVKLLKNSLVLRKEKSEKDGYHTALEEEFSVYLFEIKKISAIRASDDFHAIPVEEPIFGYKSIMEENGKLLAKDHEYELNKKNEVEIRNPYITDFQDCYFHFCTSMEDVALCPGPTKYLQSIKDYVEGYPVQRLFRVKAEGHCVRIPSGWWVTNTLTVLEEVSKNEIYQYYIENTKAREMVSKHYNLSQDFWEKFLKSDIAPYEKNSKWNRYIKREI